MMGTAQALANGATVILTPIVGFLVIINWNLPFLLFFSALFPLFLKLLFFNNPKHKTKKMKLAHKNYPSIFIFRN